MTWSEDSTTNDTLWAEDSVTNDGLWSEESITNDTDWEDLEVLTFWVTEDGDRIVTESGDYILVTT